MAASSGEMLLVIKSPSRPNSPYELRVPLDVTVAQLHQLLSEQYEGKPPVDTQRVSAWYSKGVWVCQVAVAGRNGCDRLTLLGRQEGPSWQLAFPTC